MNNAAASEPTVISRKTGIFNFMPVGSTPSSVFVTASVILLLRVNVLLFVFSGGAEPN